MIQRESRPVLKLELFPFISLFLCVIGVLAFLQNLMVMGDIGSIEEEAARQPQIFHTAFRIECHVDRIVLRAPQRSLDDLRSALALNEIAGLEQILERRQQEHRRGGTTISLVDELDQATLLRAFNEIMTVNRLAEAQRFPYEEYVLFEVFPEGADVFHYLRQVLDSPEYRSIRSGLEHLTEADQR